MLLIIFLSSIKSKNKLVKTNEKKIIKKYWRNLILLIKLKIAKINKKKIIKKNIIKKYLNFYKSVKFQMNSLPVLLPK